MIERRNDLNFPFKVVSAVTSLFEHFNGHLNNRAVRLAVRAFGSGESLVRSVTNQWFCEHTSEHSAEASFADLLGEGDVALIDLDVADQSEEGSVGPTVQPKQTINRFHATDFGRQGFH